MMLFLQAVPPNPAAAVSVSLPAGGLPLLLVAVLLLGYFAVIIYALSKASQFKAYAQDFPSQTAPVVVALVLILLSAPVYLTLIALRLDFPDGAGLWLASLLTMAGVAGVGALAVKRFSSSEYKDGQAKVEAAKAAATPPTPQPQVSAPGAIVQTVAQPPAVPGALEAAAGIQRGPARLEPDA